MYWALLEMLKQQMRIQRNCELTRREQIPSPAIPGRTITGEEHPTHTAVTHKKKKGVRKWNVLLAV